MVDKNVQFVSRLDAKSLCVTALHCIMLWSYLIIIIFVVISIIIIFIFVIYFTDVQVTVFAFHTYKVCDSFRNILFSSLCEDRRKNMVIMFEKILISQRQRTWLNMFSCGRASSAHRWPAHSWHPIASREPHHEGTPTPEQLRCTRLIPHAALRAVLKATSAHCGAPSIVGVQFGPFYSHWGACLIVKTRKSNPWSQATKPAVSP